MNRKFVGEQTKATSDYQKIHSIKPHRRKVRLFRPVSMVWIPAQGSWYYSHLCHIRFVLRICCKWNACAESSLLNCNSSGCSNDSLSYATAIITLDGSWMRTLTVMFEYPDKGNNEVMPLTPTACAMLMAENVVAQRSEHRHCTSSTIPEWRCLIRSEVIT